MNPHFWRTHDGGKTWTEINNGIAAGAVANSIREDPRTKGLLYAATDLQVWVSFDDGDHWSSLRLDMPPVSVRDIQVKDDSTCLCSDLVAGTHGRGFWILDNVTPLRQAAEALAQGRQLLFKPATAVRIRFATNDPDPVATGNAGRRESAAGGPDRLLPRRRMPAQVKLEILDPAGKLVRSYTSDDKALDPDPARDPEKYNEICKADADAPDCSLPLYWPAPSVELSPEQGHAPLQLGHALRSTSVPAADGGGSGGAVPHRTYPASTHRGRRRATTPCGSRLTARRYTQPIMVKLDPRVKTPPLALHQLFSLTREMYAGAQTAQAAATAARALVARTRQAAGRRHRRLQGED